MRARGRTSSTAARQGPGAPSPQRSGFTLIEMLVVISVTGLLISLMLPALSAARDTGRAAVCLSNQRQLVAGWTLYAGEFNGSAMPAGDDRSAAPDVLYWWGAVTAGPPAAVDHERGFLSPYLSSNLSERSAYECPAQPWGSYRAQPATIPAPGVPTSTYGYNGYYLCPPMTPGWSQAIGRQRWKRLSDIERPASLLVFGDTLLPTSPARNDPLLDPPMLYSGNGHWEANASPTTCFRHAAGRAAILARSDASAATIAARPGWVVFAPCRVGSVGEENDPFYVPDWRRWR